MNSYDISIIQFLNQFAQRSYTFDQIVIFISDSSILKGGVFAILLWWFWFRHKDEHLPAQNEDRADVMTVILACALAVFLVRVLAVVTPFKLRPIHNPGINFVVPYDMNTDILQTWNSFPSDHAAMFISLALSFWFMFRPLGSVMLFYAVIVICLPRVYLGLHYPTDIMAGGLVGVGAVCLARSRPVRKQLCSNSLRWMRRHPASFYAVFFLVTYQIAVIFDDVRDIAKFLLHLVDVTLKFIE